MHCFFVVEILILTLAKDTLSQGHKGGATGYVPSPDSEINRRLR